MKKMVRPVLFAGVAVLVAVGLAACGSSSDGGTSSSAESSNGAEAPKSDESQKIWDEALEGTNAAPASGGPKPKPGKRITVVDYGLESYSGQAFKQGAEEGAKAAGWQINVVDGEFSSNKELTAIRKAVAEKV